jgi:hypothetical protein
MLSFFLLRGLNKTWRNGGYWPLAEVKISYF